MFMPAATSTSTFTSVSASASASTYTGAFALLCSTAVWLLFHASFLVCLLFLLVPLPFPSPLFLVSLLFPQFLLLLRFFRTTSELSIVARQSSRNNCSYKVRINTHCHRAEVGDNQTERGRKRGRARERDSTSEAIGKNKVRSCSWDNLLTTLSLVFARAKKRTQRNNNNNSIISCKTAQDREAERERDAPKKLTKFTISIHKSKTFSIFSAHVELIS